MTGADEVPMYDGRMVLYHGGVPGLRVGGWILPPARTGSKLRSDEYGQYPAGFYDPAMVYMVTSLDSARSFAAMCGTELNGRGGDVYRVIPTLPLSLDPNCEDEGISWCAARARITGIVATSVRRAKYVRQIEQIQDDRARGRLWTPAR